MSLSLINICLSNKSRDKEKAKIMKFWLPVFICMCVIFYASSLPGKDIPSMFSFQDIFYHLFIYLIFGFIFMRALVNTCPGMTKNNAFILTAILGFLYGVSDELHQAFVPFRSVSALDLLFDTLGILIGGLIYAARKKLYRND